MHEVVTIQLGQQSNYVGAHFWNTQESYFTYDHGEESLVDHDIHWRQGIGADGSDTFMPRTVIYDLKGGFGSLKKTNGLYELESDRAPEGTVWNGPTVVHEQARIGPSVYQQRLEAGLPPPELDTDTVRYWSDFNRPYLHPRSIVQLNEFELGSGLVPFRTWATGDDLFASLDREHDLLDRDLRPFAEEADRMQGIQLMTSSDDAWGGFASRYVERLRDEYGKTTVWVWALQEHVQGVQRADRLLRLANKARMLAHMYKQASLLVPIAVSERLPRSISLDVSSPWHVSALVAAAMETATLPARLRDGRNAATMDELTSRLHTPARQTLAGLHMGLLPARPDSSPSPRPRPPPPPSSPEEDADRSRPSFHSAVNLSPSDRLDRRRRSRRQDGLPTRPRLFGRVVILRRGHAASAPARQDALHGQSGGRCRTAFFHSSLAFPLLDSFPRIFRHARGTALTGSVDMQAALASDSSTSASLELLRATVARSFGLEDRETLGNELAEMADDYAGAWSSGSDEGDDD